MAEKKKEFPLSIFLLIIGVILLLNGIFAELPDSMPSVPFGGFDNWVFIVFGIVFIFLSSLKYLGKLTDKYIIEK